jgi:nickel-type superoxide dismutase maturation protease
LTSSPYPWGRRRLPGATGLLAAGLGLGIFLIFHGLFERIEVEGPSMLPALSPGERLLVLKSPVLEEGDIVALMDPEHEGRLLVKRISLLGAFEVEVLGDNPGASRDSRQFGPVGRKRVLGRIVYRYHPAPTAGRISRRGGPRPPGTMAKDLLASGGRDHEPHS